MGPEPRRSDRQETLLAGLAGEVLWSYSAAGVAAVTNLAVLAFALRRLSLVDFGTYAILATVTQLFTFLDFSLSTTAIRAAAIADSSPDAEEREGALQAIRAVHACNLGLAGVLLAITTGGSMIVALVHGPVPAALIGLLGAAACLSTGTASLLGVATGARRFRQLAFATLAGVSASALIAVLFVGAFGVAILGAAELVRIVVSRGLIAKWVRPLGSLGLPSRPSLASLRETWRPAWPLVAISAAGLVVSSTDVLLLGILSGSAAAGAYRIGSLLPMQAAGLLFRGYDAAFPLLAGERDPVLQTQVTRTLTRVFSILAAAGLGMAALHAEVVVRALSGDSGTLSSQVLIAFAIVWSVNVVIHGPVLHLLSRGGQALLGRVVLAELVLNVLLTIGLVVLVGPIGAAVASLIAVIASNFILAPAMMRGALGAEVGRTVWLTGSAGLLAGAAGAVVGRLVAAPLSSSAVRISVAFAVTAACAGAAIALLSTKEEKRLLAGSVHRRIAHPTQAPAVLR